MPGFLCVGVWVMVWFCDSLFVFIVECVGEIFVAALYFSPTIFP